MTYIWSCEIQIFQAFSNNSFCLPIFSRFLSQNLQPFYKWPFYKAKRYYFSIFVTKNHTYSICRGYEIYHTHFYLFQSIDSVILTRLGLDGTNSCPGARGVNPKNIKFLIAIFVSLGLVVFLSKQMMTCSQCRTSSAYSKRETKASLLPLQSCWLDTPANKNWRSSR